MNNNAAIPTNPTCMLHNVAIHYQFVRNDDIKSFHIHVCDYTDYTNYKASVPARYFTPSFNLNWRDVVIYDNTALETHLTQNNKPVPRWIYGLNHYQKLVQAVYTHRHHALDILVVDHVAKGIWPAGRRHLAAFKIQQRWRRAINDPKSHVCRKVQLRRIDLFNII